MTKEQASFATKEARNVARAIVRNMDAPTIDAESDIYHQLKLFANAIAKEIREVKEKKPVV